MKISLSNRPLLHLVLWAGALGALAGCGEPLEQERALAGGSDEGVGWLVLGALLLGWRRRRRISASGS